MHNSFFFLLLFWSAAFPLCRSHNITRILSAHPDFSTFNHYLSATHLAAEINSRKTITVLALDNSAMSSLLSARLPLQPLKNLLSLHVLVDYFGAAKLHQITGGTALSSTLFQSSGLAPAMSGFVNITDLRAGRVSFSPVASSSPSSFFVKSLKEIPYTIAVLQISSPLSSLAALAPTPSPAQIDLISLMSIKGCRTFAGLLNASAAGRTFEDSVAAGGLSIFCPVDQAMRPFLPKFDNLTAAEKTSVLLYHGIPAYESLDMLRSHNGPASTLATTTKNYRVTVQNEGASVVTLLTKVTRAKITGTLVDEDPLAMYTIDQVLEPRELFGTGNASAAAAPAPSPALAPVADAPAKAPKAKKKGKKKPEEVLAPAPGGPEGAPADETAADVNGAGRICLRHWATTVAAAAVALCMFA